MSRSRKVLHIDMDAFFASVEQRDNPQLRARPIIVGGAPDSRGVVAACSYEARQFGVHSAMPCSRAQRLCPEAIFVKPRFDAYKQASTEIHAIFKRYTALIEPLSLDEAYLDVTSSSQFEGSAVRIAQAIKSDIHQELNLTASAGVSYNKFLAKIASDYDKPNGLFVIRPDQAEAFIAELPIRKFFGVGKVTEEKMHRLKIYNGADLRRWREAELKPHFGKSASYYYKIARGIDERPVSINRKRKSVGKETTFAKDITDKATIWSITQDLTQSVCDYLAAKMLFAKTITLKLRYDNFQLITRSTTLPKATRSRDDFLHVLPELLRKTEAGKRPIRLLGVTASNLVNEDDSDTLLPESLAQLGLFAESDTI